MERTHLAVLLGLLAFTAWVPAAAPATGGAVERAQVATGATTAEASCEPTILATQVALFCAPDMPTAQCCEPVVASVDLGGGVPCLCRVAAEPQLIISGLNATHLLTLYTACGGLRPGGARLAAACEVSNEYTAFAVSYISRVLTCQHLRFTPFYSVWNFGCYTSEI
uniref:Bifunctional inhibitor/plant lipid transfer protein/seed storage helical domain-containing protein n=1 Tax=Leersia perrieri TaxID=77586 RepID=A0A0D9VX52_9ORYZ